MSPAKPQSAPRKPDIHYIVYHPNLVYNFGEQREILFTGQEILLSEDRQTSFLRAGLPAITLTVA
jgi:hypothetical protein